MFNRNEHVLSTVHFVHFSQNHFSLVSVFNKRLLIIFGLAVGLYIPAAISMVYTLCVLGKCFALKERTEDVIQLVLEVIQVEKRNLQSLLHKGDQNRPQKKMPRHVKHEELLIDA